MAKKNKTFLYCISTLSSLLLIFSYNVFASKLTTGYPILSNNEAISIQVEFPETETGDLYLAVMYNNELLFVSNDFITTTPTPALSNMSYSGTIALWAYDSSLIPAGNYLFYQVVTQPGADPLEPANWIGGAAGLNHLNFAVRQSAASVHDKDGDGWYDDDANRDGLHDTDLDMDGFFDDDLDKDGYRDDDLDKDGIPGVSETPVEIGKRSYVLTCSRSGCHHENPRLDREDAMDATNIQVIKRAVSRDKGGMGYLGTFMTDQDYQYIVDYINSL